MTFFEYAADLWHRGKLKLDATPDNSPIPSDKRRVFHIPCRLGKRPTRPVHELELSRALGLQMIDEDVSRSLCCGGGGGQLFLDHSRAITQKRRDELVQSGCQAVVTACPFCAQMLGGEMPPTIQMSDIAEDIVSRGHIFKP